MSPPARDPHQRLLRAVEQMRDELVELTAELIRIPTVNPPGEHYRDAAELVERWLRERGFSAELVAALGRPEHTARHPRINTFGRLGEGRARPCLHLSGHLDVVPAGDGWTHDPFAGAVAGGRIYGRGSADMKGGLVCALLAAAAFARAQVPLRGSLHFSATADEESGGYAGVAYLAERGLIHRDHTDWVVIPEPFSPHRVCIGHRGVLWLRVVAHGRGAHGSMPFLGTSAITAMAELIARLERELLPRLQNRRAAMPVTPEAARRPTINVNSIAGGQPDDGAAPSPCVADHCVAVIDRRFLPEEAVADVVEEIAALARQVERDVPGCTIELVQQMLVLPTQTPESSPLSAALRRAIAEVVPRACELVASPGTYDHKHVARIAGIPHCVAYGPGELEQAHQPDESVAIDDLVRATQVLALATFELVG